MNSFSLIIIASIREIENPIMGMRIDLGLEFF